MRPANTAARVMILAMAACVSIASVAHAAPFNDLFAFGDSYTDTGAFSVASNGSTAVGYLAQDLGITLTTSNNPNPGTDGVNFAESGALVSRDPPPSVVRPRSLNTQVGEFQSDVTSGALTFNPATSLFLLFGGLNEQTFPVSLTIAATAAQVSALYASGARHIEIGLLPSISPLFAYSAADLNPAYTALVPQLQAEFPDAQITLSDWGLFYDSTLANAAQYGFTNTSTAGCYDTVARVQTCTNPNSYFFYIPDHPSAATHKIVGDDLYQEALGLGAVPVPEPMSLAIMGTALFGLVLTRRRDKQN